MRAAQSVEWEAHVANLVRDGGHGPDVDRDITVASGDPYVQRGEVLGIPPRWVGQWLNGPSEKRVRKLLADTATPGSHAEVSA